MLGLNKICYHVVTNFYILFCLFSLLSVFNKGQGLIPLLKIICLLFVFRCLWVYKIKANRGSLYLNFLLLSIILSCINYIYKDVPISLLTEGIMLYFFPVIFYYLGLLFDDKIRSRFYSRISTALVFTYLVGIYLYFMSPTWYLAWRVEALESWLGSSASNYVMTKMNLSSFFSHPYFVGYTGLWFICYLCNKIYKKEGRITILFPQLFMAFLIEVLAQQRAPMAISLVVLLIYTIVEIRKKRMRLTYMSIILFCAFIYLLVRFSSEFSVVIERLSSLSDGSILKDDRNEQWISAFKNYQNLILGEGFNIAGHAAIKHGMPSIADGEFFKIIYELGILGAGLFYGFAMATILRGLKNIEKYAVETPVAIGFIVCQYGANTFEMTNIIILFWFSAGVIWRRNNDKQLIMLEK